MYAAEFSVIALLRIYCYSKSANGAALCAIPLPPLVSAPLLCYTFPMQDIIDLIFEFFAEGAVDAATDRRVSPWVRIPLGVLLLALVVYALGTVVRIGIRILGEGDAVGLFLIAFGAVLLALFLWFVIWEWRRHRRKK